MAKKVLTEDNFNEEIEFLEYLVVGEAITITKEIALDSGKIKQILDKEPNCRINILSGYDDAQRFSKIDSLYDEQELAQLKKNAQLIKEKTGKDITFDSTYSLDQVINASNQINEIVDKIKNARVKGRELTPYEKLLYIHTFVSSKPYREQEEGEDRSVSRNLISVLNGDKMVCVAYAELMAYICSRVNIPCTMVTATVEQNKEGEVTYTNHVACLVRIEDPEYRLNGIYYSDATSSEFSKLYNPTLSLVPVSEVENVIDEDKIHLEKIYIPSYFDKDNTKCYSKNVRKTDTILSPLFPEINNGKNQKELIREYGKQEIERLGIYDQIVSLIDSLTEEDMVNSLKEKYRKKYDPRKIAINMKSYNNNLNSFSLDIISEMVKDGFSKDEAVELLQEIYDDKRFFEEEYGFCLSVDTVEVSDKSLKNLQEQCEILKKHREILPQLASQYNIKDPILKEHIEKGGSIGQYISLSDIVEHIIKKHYPSENIYHKNNLDISTLGQFIKLGVPKEKLVSVIKEKLKTYDLVGCLLDVTKQSIYQTNENAMYINGDFETQHTFDYVYNEPYRKTYEKMTKEANAPSVKDAYRAFAYVYVAQGYSPKDALKKALNTVSYMKTFDEKTL